MTPLTEADLRSLRSRWISPQLAATAGLVRVASEEGRELVHRNRGDYAGILIPYAKPGCHASGPIEFAGGSIITFRIRRDKPDLERNKDGTHREMRKYMGPPQTRNHLYFPPLADPSILQDSRTPVVITEGELKTLALWGLSQHLTGHPQFLSMGLSGVWNFRGVIGKTADAQGTRRDVKGPVSDLDLVNWLNRKVIIAFDADLHQNDSVKAARYALTRELLSRNARVATIDWDPKLGKGIDDLLASQGPQIVLDLLADADFDERGWVAKLLCTEAGKPKGNLANAITAFELAPEWTGVLAFNEFSLAVHSLASPPWRSAPGIWTDHEDRKATAWLQHQGIDVGVDVAGQAVQTVARENPFHPLRDYLQGLEWDGTPRIDSWLTDYMGVEPSHYSEAVGAKWLIAAVARAFAPGCKVDTVLVLEGAQGIGKSTALRILAGEWFRDSMPDLHTKDAALQCAGTWILEMSELEGLGKSDVSSVKAFITRGTDSYRPPYGKRTQDVPRQCIFAGTVNESTGYLNDSTGGRRFWPVECGSANGLRQVDTAGLAKVRNQLWAEAIERYRQGKNWWLEDERIVNEATEAQEKRFVDHPWQDKIDRYIHERPRDMVTMDMLLTVCLEKPTGQWTITDRKTIAAIMRKLGWTYEVYADGIKRRRAFFPGTKHKHSAYMAPVELVVQSEA